MINDETTQDTEQKFYKNISLKTGLDPGSLIHVGETLVEQTVIRLVDFTSERVIDKQIHQIEELFPFKKTDSITWLNIQGLSNIEHIQAMSDLFNIHPLVLEDILNTQQRPKFEAYDDYLFIVLKAQDLNLAELYVGYEQVSILVMKNLIITFKEKPDSLFEPIVKRIQNPQSRFRNQGTDYLLYSLLDIIVDQGFEILDAFEDSIEALDEEVLNHPTQETLIKIQTVKRELIEMRRATLPLKDLVNGILRSDNKLLKGDNLIYFRDVYDHILRVNDIIDTYRDLLGGLLDIYMSSISQRMNEIMKVLTIFSTIFIPLTFFAGVYGMNFSNMPELETTWGYYAMWGFFITLAASMLALFRRNKWI